MFVVLYGVALAMIGGGAYAAFTGWEFLMLERGWSMVIAGSTLATGGLVLGGLSAAAQALARRLDSLGEALRGSARTQPAVFPKRPAHAEPTVGPVAPAAPVLQPPDREIEPKIPGKLPPREPVSPAGPAPAAALGIGGIAAEAVLPDATRPPPEPEGGLAPIDLTKVPGAEERESEAPATGEPAAEPDADEAAALAEEPLQPAAAEAEEPEEPAEPAEPEEEPAPEEAPHGAVAVAIAVAGSGIEEPVMGRRERGRIEAEAEALTRRFEETSFAFGAAPRGEPEAGEESDAALERLAATVAEPAPPREPSHALEEAALEAEPADAPHVEDADVGRSPEEAGAEPPEPPVVVGTHVSGANRYVMYSDGSIEADTPDGRLIFGSIDELKGYIASGGEDPSGTTQTGPR